MPIFTTNPLGHISGSGSPNYLSGGYACDTITISGTLYAVVTAYEDDAVVIIDISDPYNPSKVGHLQGTGTPNYLDGVAGVKCLEISGTPYAFAVSSNDNALVVINLSTPSSPSLTTAVTGAGSPYYLDGAIGIDLIEISSTWYAIITAKDDDYVNIYNINTPGTPTRTGGITGTGSPNYLDGAHGVKTVVIDSTEYACVTGFFDNSFVVIDISTPASPALSDVLQGSGSPNYLQGAHSVDIATINSVEYAFVTGYYDDSLVVINISDPADISLADVIYYSEDAPYYMGEPCHVEVVQMASGDYYALIAGYITDALVGININDPTDIRFVNVVRGSGYPNYFYGLHGFTVDSGILYGMGYNEDSFVSHELTEDGTYIAMVSNPSISTSTSFDLRETQDIDMTSTCNIQTTVTFTITPVAVDFSDQIGLPNYNPSIKVFMLDINDVEVEITDYVKGYDRILWQTDQVPFLNIFNANNTSVFLRNDDFEFDPDVSDNFFVTTLNREQDGYLTPVIIKGGYIVDGEELLIDIFKGLITDMNLTTQDNIIKIDLQCVSRILRDTKCVDIGDQWSGQRLYGGYVIAYLDEPINEDDTNIPASDGGFDEDFPPSGYIQIEDEIIYYGAKTDTHFVYCMRGRHGTTPASHARSVGGTSQRRKIFLTLDDGSDTDSRYFQFPLYPVSQKSVSATTSDGTIDVLDDRDIYISIPEWQKRLIAYVDYEKGWLEFSGAPSDPSSVSATFKNVPRMISYSKLAKILLESKDYETSLIEDVIMYERNGWDTPYLYGRIAHARSGDQQVALPNLRCQALTDDGTNTYLGIGSHVVQWNDEQFTELCDLSSAYEIVKLGIDSNGNIYGIARPSYEEPDDALEKGWVFKFDGESVSFLTGQVASYYPVRGRNIPGQPITSIPPDAGIQGAQWHGFSVDDTYNCCWFSYNNGTTKGLAKVTFTGTVTYYSRSVEDDDATDFVDSGDYIHFFYQYVGGGRERINYDRLTKSSGSWASIETGYLWDRVYADYRELVPFDATYNPDDSKVYMNIIDFNNENDIWQGANGWFISFPLNGTTVTTLAVYDDDYAHVSKYSGGVAHDGYAYFVKGAELAIGQEIDDETPLDDANGHLYRIDSNEFEDLGALAYRPVSKTAHFLRESVKGISATMVSRPDEAVFFVSCDATTRNTPDGYLFGRYAKYFKPVVRVADINDRSIWEVLTELAMISGYELGVSRYGKVFLRPRTPDRTTLTSAINDAVTTIPAEDTTELPDDGIIQIDNEVITYTGKTSNSFTGCTRGAYDSIAVSHAEDAVIWRIDHVIINMDHDKRERSARKDPNWLGIYNYIEVPFGSRKLIFDYQRMEHAWEDSSEYRYGRKTYVVSNSFLTDDDYVVADILGFRYYDLFASRSGNVETETVWQPQIDMGEVFTIYQPRRALLNYTIARIKRIELWLHDFKVMLLGHDRPSGFRRTVYDLEYS